LKQAEIIAIGDELIIGQVVNTNASWIAWELNATGIGIVRMTCVGDDKKAITSALGEAFQRADFVLMTGGLGPTKDDITKAALCEYFKQPMRLDASILEHIKVLLAGRGYAMSEKQVHQAMVPYNAVALPNELGTAPCLWFEVGEQILVVMPGVPHEMKDIMTRTILPRLQKRSRGSVILHKTILTTGVGESHLSSMIEDWELALPPFIRLAYLPQPGIIRLRLTAQGTDEPVVQKALKEQVSLLQQRIPDLIFGYDEDSLEVILGKMLGGHHQTLATAESCTGGYIAHLITTVPGSSAYFSGSVVAYANEIKIRELGVDPKILLEHGAVSEQVVLQMASGVRDRFKTDLALAVSGIAGPDGGTPEKPVGTVWIAVTTPSGTQAKKFFFRDERRRTIHRTAIAAMNMLRLTLLGKEI
jgi:nicotinamide-nucleotide amidase